LEGHQEIRKIKWRGIMPVELAIEATVTTLVVIFGLLWFINQAKIRRNNVKRK